MKYQIYFIMLLLLVTMALAENQEVRSIRVCANITPIDEQRFSYAYSSDDGNAHSFELQRDFNTSKTDCSVLYTTISCNATASEKACYGDINNLTNSFNRFSGIFNTSMSYIDLYNNCSILISNVSGCADKLHYESDFINCKDQLAVLNRQLGNCSSLGDQVSKSKTERYIWFAVGALLGVLGMKVYEGRKYAKTPVQRIPGR